MNDEEKVNLQHIQLPNNMTATKELTPKDLLIYVCIKKFMNGVTKECFPSLETLMKLSGVTKPTVRKSIEKLKELEYITVRREGRKNVYKFSPYKNFEPFSYAFLEKEDISANEKAYLIAAQQHMFKDVDGLGKISYPDHKLSDIINMSYNSITKYNRSLAEKGYLDIIRTSAKDSVTGIMINEKVFKLNELEQTIVFTLQNHEDRLTSLEISMKKQLEIYARENKILKDIINEHNTIDITV